VLHQFEVIADRDGNMVPTMESQVSAQRCPELFEENSRFSLRARTRCIVEKTRAINSFFSFVTAFNHEGEVQTVIVRYPEN